MQSSFALIHDMISDTNKPGMNSPSSDPPVAPVHVGRDYRYRAGDNIGSIGTQHNDKIKHTYGANNQYINHGQDQNVNSGAGQFSVNHAAKDTSQWKAENGVAEREEDKNPFRKLNNSDPTRPRSDTELLEQMRLIMGNEQRSKGILNRQDAGADRALESLQRASYLSECEQALRSSILEMMSKLSEASGRSIPWHYNAAVQKQGDKPYSSETESFVEVWKGMIGDGFPVALKVVKQNHKAEVEKRLNDHFREMLNLRRVNNTKVLSFIGNFSFGPDKAEMCLVTQWMENGNIVEYLQKNQPGPLHRFSLVWDVAGGLEHLHDLGIIHGNLKGVNVMITSDESACITDFGLGSILQPAGKVRPTPWSAPELLEGGTITKSSDVYAYGCVCYEIFFGYAPFHNLDESRLHETILNPNQLPERPSTGDVIPWEAMERCWSRDAGSRPSAAELVKEIEKMLPSVEDAVHI